MNHRVLALLALLTLLVTCLVPALVLGQDERPRSFYPNHKWLGLGLQASLPYADFADAQNTGYGIAALVDYPIIPWFSLVGDVGWNRFDSKSDNESLDVWQVDFGGRFNLPPFVVGGEAGWYSEIDKIGWVPSLGIRLERFELSVRWQASGTTGWTTFRFGFYLL